MRLIYVDSLSNIDGENVDIYETETGFRYRAGNFISRVFSGYDTIIKFLMERGFIF